MNLKLLYPSFQNIHKIPVLLWIGVDDDQVVLGVMSSRQQRDRIRQELDRICSQKINPNVTPKNVSIDFLKVLSKCSEDLHVIKISVKVTEITKMIKFSLRKARWSNDTKCKIKVSKYTNCFIALKFIAQKLHLIMHLHLMTLLFQVLLRNLHINMKCNCIKLNSYIVMFPWNLFDAL